MIITWKKTIRKIWKHLKLNTWDKFYLWAKIESWNIDKLEAIGLSIPLTIWETILPSEEASKFAKYNASWKEIIDKSQRETVTREMPYDILDWRGNPHSWTYFKKFERYKRDIIWDFNMELSTIEVSGQSYIIVNQEFEYISTKETEIIFAINLLLSIFWEARVLNEDLEAIDTTSYKKVNWRFLPLWDSPFKTIDSIITSKYTEPHKQGPMLRRQEFLKSLNPDEIFVWEGWFNVYFAYFFKTQNITILESMEYWNAIYIFDSDWKALSKKTKKEILDGGLEKERIIHYKGYKRKVLSYF